MLTTTSTVVARLRLSCHHALHRSEGFTPWPATAKVDDKFTCPKCKPKRNSYEHPTRRIKDVTMTDIETPVVDVVANQAAHAGAVIEDAFTEAIEAIGNIDGDTGDVVAYDMWKAQDEHRATAAWIKGGRKGDAPATPNLDAMNAAHAAGQPRTGRKNSAKKAAMPKRTRAAGIRFHVGDRAMPDSQNKLSSVAWQATKGLGDDGGRLNTTALVALLADNGVTDPENAAWSVTLANDVTISATI